MSYAKYGIWYDVSIIDIWKQLALFVNIMQLHSIYFNQLAYTNRAEQQLQ